MKYLLALALFGAACGAREKSDATSNHEQHATNNSTNSMADTYADGMMKVGEMDNFHVMLMSATPGPPDVGDNTWTLRVVDMEDNPIDDATVIVSPFMPAHGHGTSPADFAGTFAADGTYEVGPFDLFMPGTWETTVTVEGEVQDMVKFTFDLEG